MVGTAGSSSMLNHRSNHFGFLLLHCCNVDDQLACLTYMVKKKNSSEKCVVDLHVIFYGTCSIFGKCTLISSIIYYRWKTQQVAANLKEGIEDEFP